MTALEFVRHFRVVAVALLAYSCVIGWNTQEWFFRLENPTTEQTVYATSTLALVFGVVTMWTKTKAHEV